MSERPRSSQRTPTARPPPDDGREWEVFCRDRPEAPLIHAGSVTAPSEDVAREVAGRLFDHAAETLWLCPVDEVRRFGERDLGAAYRDADATPTGGGPE